MVKAMNAITEYRMVSCGVATYDKLGYGDSRVKLLEWVVISNLIEEASEEKRNR